MGKRCVISALLCWLSMGMAVLPVIHTLYGKVEVTSDDGVLRVTAPLGCEEYDKNNNLLP